MPLNCLTPDNIRILTIVLAMSLMPQRILPILFVVFVSCFYSCSCSCTFTITNNCPYTIWPGTLAGSGTQLQSTGFRLDSGQRASLAPVPGWSGRIWARTGCTFDASGAGKCQTGDCGGRLECNGNGATPPASLFEVTLATGNQKDFYDVSLVDGYNLPIIAIPRSTSGACNATGCISDVNMGCPKELQVVGSDGGEGGGVVACKSACEAFGQDQYCCSGQFANPTTCRPSFYSSLFKRACPRAYSYAFDDGTSTFTCNAFEYDIVFCPNRIKRPNGGLISPSSPMPSSSSPIPPSTPIPSTGGFSPPSSPMPSTGGLTPPTTPMPYTGGFLPPSTPPPSTGSLIPPSTGGLMPPSNPPPSTSGLMSPSIPIPNNRAGVELTSSSNILLPIPISVLPLILALLF